MLFSSLVEELVVTHSEYHTVQYGVDIVSEDLYGILSSSQYEETPNDDVRNFNLYRTVHGLF